MRIFPIASVSCGALALAVTLVGGVSAASQEASPSQPQEQLLPFHNRVFGYQDRGTGAFHALPTVVPEAVTSPIAGTITLTLHITLKSAIPSGGKVVCGGTLQALFTTTTGSTSYEELAYAPAAVSGASATCTISIPHSWQFPAPNSSSQESLFGSYTAAIVSPGSTSVPQLGFLRESVSNFVSLRGANVFATAPTTYSVNVTL